MQLPQEGSALNQYRRCSMFTARRLRVVGRVQQATDAIAMWKALRDASMALDDAEDPLMEAFADRDTADLMLDPVVEETSRGLGSRSAKGKTTAPWTDIFPDTAGYYTASPTGEQESRYRLFGDRLVKFLPADDPVRVKAVPLIAAGLEKWIAAEKAVGKATVDVDAARSRRDHAEEAWRTFMDKLYASLRADLGKDEAETFFRKINRRTEKDPTPKG